MTRKQSTTAPWQAGALALALALVAGGLPRAATAQEAGWLPPAAPAAAATGGLPDARATYMTLIRELQAQGQSFAALAHIAQYEARWGASPDTQVLRADALRATGQHEAAAALYRQLLGGPRAAAAHRGLGLLEAAAGHWSAAIGPLAAAARLDPTDAATLGDLGYARLRAGRIAEARVPLMTAAQLRPTDSRTLANLASYFMASGQADQAEAVLRSPHVSEQARAMVRGRPDAAAPVALNAPVVQPVAGQRDPAAPFLAPAVVPIPGPAAMAVTDTDTDLDVPTPSLRLAPSLAPRLPATAGRPAIHAQGETP